MSSPLITITNSALKQIGLLIKHAPSTSHIFRVSVKKGGCSGFKYDFEFVEKPGEHDEIVESEGTKICIDPSAVLYLIGSELDYQTDTFSERFVFNNPNEKDKCGCGESAKF